MFKLRVSNKAEKQLRLLEPKMRYRVFELFRVLENEPVPSKAFDLTKLGGTDATYRARLSSFRVVYTVFWKEKLVRIVKVERRTDATYA